MALSANPFFAYLTIALLQLRRMWGIFRYRDMTAGDDRFWYIKAWHWSHDRHVDIAWSPAFSIFHGSLLYFTTDAASVMFLNRLVIAIVATVMVLAVMRRLLPPTAAWLVAAWWAVMPINFDTMYEVHLFAVLPLLACWIIVLAGDTPWYRGAALGVLLLDAFLIRNETIITAAFIAAVCLIWELRARRRSREGEAPAEPGFGPAGRYRLGRSLALPYSIPLLVLTGAVVMAYARSSKKFPELWEYLELKHTVNMAQVYAFGYHQRHPEWKGDPWTQDPEICKKDFGTPLPTFASMARRNPAAAAAHVLWNLSLIPNGIQLMLFCGTPATRDPDYPGLYIGKRYPIPLIAIALVVVVAGIRTLRKEWDVWWPSWIRPRGMAWLAMICVVPSAFLVMLIERPRPSYLFGLTLLLMAFIGLCGVTVVRRFPSVGRLAPGMPVLMVLLALTMPSFYVPRKRGRPLFESYERLRPYELLLARSDTAYLGPHPDAVQAFIGHGLPDCFGYAILDQRPQQMRLADFLDARHINLFELDPAELVLLQSTRPQLLNDFLQLGNQKGWHLVASHQLQDGSWMLFSRATAPSSDNPLAGGAGQ